MKDRYFQDHEARWNNIGELISIAAQQKIENYVVDHSLYEEETIDSGVCSIEPSILTQDNSDWTEK